MCIRDSPDNQQADVPDGQVVVIMFPELEQGPLVRDEHADGDPKATTEKEGKNAVRHENGPRIPPKTMRDSQSGHHRKGRQK